MNDIYYDEHIEEILEAVEAKLADLSIADNGVINGYIKITIEEIKPLEE